MNDSVRGWIVDEEEWMVGGTNENTGVSDEEMKDGWESMNGGWECGRTGRILLHCTYKLLETKITGLIFV